MLALYRIIEPSAGSIKIDGIEVTGIGLYDLRSRLSLVPQDPVIFTGSVRTNLAPFDDATDGAMWEALRQAGLEQTVRGYEVCSLHLCFTVHPSACPASFMHSCQYPVCRVCGLHSWLS